MTNILDYLINRLPVVRWFNGRKTKIAGGLTALGGCLNALAPILPPEYAALAGIAGAGLIKASSAVGTWGLVGKGVKLIKVEPAK